MTAPAPRRLLGDLALWAALCGAHVVWFRGDPAPSVARDLVLPLLVATVVVPLARHRPTAAVALAGALCAAGLADATSPAHVAVLTLGTTSCLLGVRTAGTRTPLLVLAGCLAAALAVCAVLRAGPVWWFYTLTVLPTALLLPWLAGRYWRGRTELVSGGWRLARSLEERQRFVAERARLTERADIAADMHDSLGHALSLAALRAGALELSPTLAGRDREDLAELRGTIADAVDQLRETVTVLRAAPDALLPSAVAPADTVEALLGRAVASGVPVRWEREGPPPVLSPLIERGVYRVVREALTNAVKHAPGSTVRVRITHDHERDHTRVRVVNALPVPGPSAVRPAGGHGLAGLRERVTVLGGTLWTGPYEDGFHVSATLPHRATPPHHAEDPDAGKDGTGKDVRGQDARGQDVGGQDGGGQDGSGRNSRTKTGGGPHAGGSASEAARRLAQVRRSTRLRLAAAFAIPAGAALFFVPAAVFLAYQLSTGVLAPSRYEELHVGGTRAELAELLPARPFPYPPDDARSAPRPPGTECVFYRSNGNLLAEVDLYRLCWSGPRLTAKDVLVP
ncbi:sensor histidine kinase [Streptomyces sp. NPDC056517]|uniref:sensor histidine kinase n=1 Tax=unclassified Streptomyces TaxID=2593676 RepID=UPI0036BA6760